MRTFCVNQLLLERCRGAAGHYGGHREHRVKTPKEIAEFRDDFSRGLSVTAIAAKRDCARNTVSAAKLADETASGKTWESIRAERTAKSAAGPVDAARAFLERLIERQPGQDADDEALARHADALWKANKTLEALEARYRDPLRQLKAIQPFVAFVMGRNPGDDRARWLDAEYAAFGDHLYARVQEDSA